MKEKILRISKETHSAFKDLCIREKKTLTEGAEIIIAKTLKQGTLSEVKKNVYTQIQGLENTFRSWMKQQEKVHLRGIQEDLIILTGRLKDVSTRTETEEIFKTGIDQLCEVSKGSLHKYEELLHKYAERKSKFLKHLKNISIAVFAVVGIYFFTILILDYSAKVKLKNHASIKRDYEALREFCRSTEEKLNIEILSPFDEAWSKLKNQP